MDSQHNPQQDKPRIHAMADGMADAAALRSVDLRARTPAEMAMQLTRNATSLELTGSHIPKDEQFYQAVAADLREAAVFLGQWQELVDSMKRAADTRERVARIDGFVKSQELALGFVELMPARAGGLAATTWRTVALAINEAIQAVRDSLPLTNEVQS